METFMHLTHDEVQRKIPYQIIAETTSRSIWQTGRRKRLWSAEFTAAEREKAGKLAKQAHRWALVSGVPQGGVTMTHDTYDLWQRFGNFCGGL